MNYHSNQILHIGGSWYENLNFEVYFGAQLNNYPYGVQQFLGCSQLDTIFFLNIGLNFHNGLFNSRILTNKLRNHLEFSIIQRPNKSAFRAYGSCPCPRLIAG